MVFIIFNQIHCSFGLNNKRWPNSHTINLKHLLCLFGLALITTIKKNRAKQEGSRGKHSKI